jgi:hypothetical protein
LNNSYYAVETADTFKINGERRKMENKLVGVVFVLMLLISALALTLNVKHTEAYTTWHVPGDFATIQAAIDAASSGDTIVVDVGTYREAIDINKPLSIIGSGQDTTFINGSGVTLSSAGLVKITATSGDVLLSGFTVSDAEAAGTTRIGILTSSGVSGPTYTISYNKIYGSNDVNEWDDYGFYASGGKENVVFTHNLITQTGANNIVLELHTGSTEISYNTLDAGVYGADSIFAMTYNGIDVTAMQNISYNTYDMGTGGPFDYDHRATAISFSTWPIAPDASFTNVVIQGNVINNLESYRRGIGFWNGGGGGGGTVAPVVEGNTITGVIGSIESYGIDFIATGSAPSAAANATLMYNTISNTSYGVYLRTSECAPGVKINYNNIAGNAVGLDTTAGSSDVDARYNWWGDPTGPYNPKSNPAGKGDDASSNVAFEPWLVQPYPPPNPVKTILYIDPAKTEFWTPAYGGTFEVDIKIADVTNLTCYEFKLYWNATLLELDYVHVIEIWPLQIIGKEEINQALGRYWLGVSARGTDRFTGNGTLVELYFRMRYDPIYPNNVYSLLNLTETVLGDASEPQPQPIPHMVHSGEYWCHSTKPKIKIEPSISIAKKLGKIFSINVTVEDVVRMYDFEFWLYYNTTLLDIYSPYVQLGPMMSGATVYAFGWDDLAGYLHFGARLTNPAPPVNGSGTIATITFEVTKGSIWPDPDLQCTLHLANTKLTVMGGLEVSHDATDGLYDYKPVIGDLTCDGTVDLDDIYIIALAYGSKPGHGNWNRVADLTRDDLINVLDLRTAARHYGEDC